MRVELMQVACCEIGPHKYFFLCKKHCLYGPEQPILTDAACVIIKREHGVQKVSLCNF